MVAPQAPCSWPPIACGCALPGYPIVDGEDPPPDDATKYAVETAAFVLWALSGRQFGACELSFRPCRRDCADGTGGGPWGARLVGGNWINLPCRSCSGPCACTEICEVRLPDAPVSAIVEVIIDGEIIDEDDYWLEDSEWLVLSPSAGCFPVCQPMNVPLGQAGTSGVRYLVGTPPPVAGQRAVGALACEILKACSGDTNCCLPKRTQQYTRGGMTTVMLDPFEFFEKRRTGIYEVDLFLMAVNPEGRPSGARVMSPDSEPRRRDAFQEFP